LSQLKEIGGNTIILSTLSCIGLTDMVCMFISYGTLYACCFLQTGDGVNCHYEIMLARIVLLTQEMVNHPKVEFRGNGIRRTPILCCEHRYCMTRKSVGCSCYLHGEGERNGRKVRLHKNYGWSGI
jgi:hypothetical protein